MNSSIMKGLQIIYQIAILYVFTWIGNVIHHIFPIPIPGSIIGLILLLICLSLKIIPLKIIENGANFLLAYLPLLFIPAMIGIMNYPSLFSISGAILCLIGIVSTIVTMLVSGTASQFLEKKTLKRKENKKCSSHLSQSL
jgi:holin-like protein